MIYGWYGVPEAKNLEELSNILLQNQKVLNHKVLDSNIQEDHIWFLAEIDNQNVVQCYFVSKDKEEYSYMPCSDEDRPNFCDIPKGWLDKITDVEERKRNFPNQDYDRLEEWLNSARWFNGVEIKEYEHKDKEVIKYTGEIKNLKHLVVTDPHYGKEVKCRYEKKFTKPEDWEVDFRITKRNYYDEFNGHKLHITGFDIDLLLVEKEKKNTNFIVRLTDEGVEYTKLLKDKAYDIGMDTAQVALGINENAKEISDYYKTYDNESFGLDDYRPYFSLETLTDGLFGTVSEFKYISDYYGIAINGWLDGDTKYDEEMIKDYFVERFQIQNLKKIEMESEENIEL